MTVSVDYFTDPLCHRSWGAEPTVRRLRFAYETVDWTPRFVPLHPDGGSDAGDPADLDGRCRAAAGPMPVAESIWVDGPPPESTTACAAVAAVRERAPGTAERYLRSLRERTFLAGAPPTDEDGLLAVAEGVDGLDAAALARDLADGTARAARTADLRRAHEAAALVGDVAARGAIRTLPLFERVVDPDDDDAWHANLDRPASDAAPDDDAPERGDGVPDDGPRGDADPEGPSVDSGDAEDSDAEEDSDDRPPAPAVVAPPTARFEADEKVMLVDPTGGYDLLREAVTTLDPTARSTVHSAAPHGTAELKSRGLPAEMAERFTDEDFAGRIERYLGRTGRATLPEVVAGVEASEMTCRLALYDLRTDGEVASATVGDVDVWMDAGGE